MKSSWDHSASVVPDKTLFFFSKPNLSEPITLPNTKANSGATGQGKHGGMKSSTTFFSNLLSPSVSEKAPGPSSSMKQENQSRSLKAVSPNLHDDPAFSPDPHAHPFYSTSHDDWTCPPMVGHPTLRKDFQRLPHLVIPTGDTRDSGEFRLIQPPNSPISPDRPPTSHSPTPPTPPPKTHIVTLPQVTVATNISSRSASSSAQSHSGSHTNLPSISRDPLSLPLQKSEKKRNPLAMLLRKSPPASPTEQNFGQKPHSEVAPPSYEAIFSDSPLSVPFDSPETKTQSSTSLSTQSTSKSADSQESIDTHRSVVGRHRKNKNRLDRIDELDETSPSGIPIHHGGPYEAIQKLAQQSRRTEPYNVGSQYAISPGSSKYGSSASGSIPPTPTPVSLNLSPGQILPRNFNDYYNPYTGIINTPPVPHPPFNGRHRTISSREHEPRDNWNRQQQWQQPTPPTSTPSVSTRPHLPHIPSQQSIPSRVATVPPTVDSQNVPSRAASSREGYNHAQYDFHPPMPAPPPPPPKLSTGEHNQGHIVRASSESYHYTKHNIHTPISAPPPPLAQLPAGGHERYSQSNSIHPSRDGFNPYPQHDIYPPVPAPPPPQGRHEHYSQGNLVRPSREGYNPHVQHDLHPPVPPPLPAQLPTGGHERYYQDNVVHPLTEHVPHVDVRPSTPPGQTQQLRDRDVQSTHRSLTSNGSTFNTRNGAMPQPRHLPKKLIMPAPLQPTLPAPSRDPLHFPPSHIRYDARIQPQQFPSRPPSPPSSLHPSFDSVISRAKDIPMSAGRKLRKQNSLSGIPSPVVLDKQVSFSANVGYSEPRPPALTPSKTIKAPKRVLSKRRTEL